MNDEIKIPKLYVENNALKNQIVRLKGQLSCVKSQMMRELNRIEEIQKVEDTGLYVCVDSELKEAWVYDSSDESEESLSRLDKASVILTIPDVETLPEFDGF